MDGWCALSFSTRFFKPSDRSMRRSVSGTLAAPERARWGRKVSTAGGAAAAAAAPARTPRKKYEDVDESELVPGTTLPDGRVVVEDWKGDPMVLNPGDRMPRF